MILQDDRFDALDSITICAFTTDARKWALFRMAVEPHADIGLDAPCSLMVDKIATVPRSKLGTRLGRLDEEDMLRLQRAALVFLGFAGSRRAAKR